MNIFRKLMSFRGISIKIIPHADAGVRDVHLPYWLLTLITLVGLGLIGGLIFLGVNFAQQVVDEDRLAMLQDQTADQGEQLTLFEEQIGKLEIGLATLDNYREQLDELHPYLSLDNPDLLEARAAEFTSSLNMDEIQAAGQAGRAAIDRLVERATKLHTSYDRIENNLQADQARLRFTPSIRPVEGEQCWITTAFGNQMSEFTGRSYFHRGIDFTAPTGTLILAPADGTVVYADHEGNFGLKLTIDHGGYYETVYTHLSRVYVQPGDVVTRAQLIAAVGTTGRTLGPKLHYEVLRGGRNLDPSRFFLPDQEI